MCGIGGYGLYHNTFLWGDVCVSFCRDFSSSGTKCMQLLNETVDQFRFENHHGSPLSCES